jgi:hypothetical protein
MFKVKAQCSLRGCCAAYALVRSGCFGCKLLLGLREFRIRHKPIHQSTTSTNTQPELGRPGKKVNYERSSGFTKDEFGSSTVSALFRWRVHLLWLLRDS